MSMYSQPSALSSNLRPVGTRLGTSSLAQKPQRVGMEAQMNIVNRPVTKDGMKGMGAQAMGPNRVVQDRSYYMTQIRQLCKQVIDEQEKIKRKIQNLNDETQQFQVLEQRFDELSSDVRLHEGSLADYNLTHDKMRANTQPEEIRNMFEHIKLQNDRQRHILDEIFLERKSQEEQIQGIDYQLHELNQICSLKINELDQDQREEYQNLVQENQTLIIQVNHQRNHLEKINQMNILAENRLRLDSSKLKGQILKEQITELQRKQTDLEVQLNESNLSFPEARDKLLSRIKEDNSLIAQNEKRVKEVRKNIDNYEKKLRELQDQQLNDQNKEEQKQKYEILYQRDKEMSEYINNYEQERNTCAEELQSTQSRIVQILEESGQIMQAAQIQVSKEQHNDLVGNLEFKQQQTEASEQTLKKLHIEFEARNGDLTKLEQAGHRVEDELKKLAEKQKIMQDDIDSKFNKVEKIKEEFEIKRETLKKNKLDLKQSKFAIAEEVKTAKYEHDLNQKKLERHEMFGQYKESQEKLSNTNNQLYNVKNFIMTKTGDMNYDQIKYDCYELNNQLNNILLKGKE